jgi:hypothetical protein
MGNHFVGASRIDPRPQSFGYDLGTEANSKHGFTSGYGLANQSDLWTKPTEPSFVIRTHRAAHDRQHVEIGKRRERGIAAKVKYAESKSATGRPIGDSRRAFEFDMPQNRHAHRSRPFCRHIRFLYSGSARRLNYAESPVLNDLANR